LKIGWFDLIFFEKLKIKKSSNKSEKLSDQPKKSIGLQIISMCEQIPEQW
jgi:hypothetical protein